MFTGVNIIAFSIILGVYGLVVYSTQLIGVAGSLGVLGGVIIALSLAYGEPTVRFMNSYFKIMNSVHVKILDDLRLGNVLPKILFSKDTGECFFVLSKRGLQTISSGEVVHGVSLLDGMPVLAIRIRHEDLGVPPEHARNYRELEHSLRSLLVDNYGVCTGVSVVEEAGVARIVLTGLKRDLAEIANTPLSPLDIIVLPYISMSLGKSIIVVDRFLEDNVFTVRIKVV